MLYKVAALVIGNGAYPGAELKNPTNDAEDFSRVLTGYGFSVTTLKDATRSEIDRAMKAFQASLASSDVGIFYFAGHGLQVGGQNYITAVDTDFSDETVLKYSSIPLNRLIESMERSNNNTNLIILDACRNNPYERAWHRSVEQSGLAPVYVPKGTLIAFATSPGQVALDGTGRNGTYTEALLRHIHTPDITVEETFKRVRKTLSAVTKGRQTSWEHTSLSGDFFFNVSLGKRIDGYGKHAIADKLFVVRPGVPGNDIIRDLRSHNWYVQNPAINALSPAAVQGIDKDTLFVIGRNIYQAACGGSTAASGFLANYSAKAAGYGAECANAILDGMLFEIFFNPKGEIRQQFKIGEFNVLFELQADPALSPSFDFISECLSLYGSRFYQIPGKNLKTSVDVVSDTTDKGEHIIRGVYFAGIDVLRNTDDEQAELGLEPMQAEALIERISEEMVIPLDLLAVSCAFPHDQKTRVLFPYGHTVSKG